MQIPSSGGVCLALRRPRGAGALAPGHCRGGVCFGDGDLFGLADLLAAVWTEALTFQY